MRAGPPFQPRWVKRSSQRLAPASWQRPGDLALHRGRASPREAAAVHELVPAVLAAVQHQDQGLRPDGRVVPRPARLGPADLWGHGHAPYSAPPKVADGMSVWTGKMSPVSDGETDDVQPTPAEARGRAPGDRRADRGRPVALLRARRPDPVRRRLRRPAAAAAGARGGVARAAHARLADPEGRRRGLHGVHRRRPPAADGEPRQRVQRRGAPVVVRPARARRRARTPTCCASSRSTGWPSTCCTRTAGWCGR